MSVERFLRRGKVVAVLVGLLQAIIFASGWLWVYEETHEAVASNVEGIIVQSNMMAAEAVQRALGGIPNVDNPDSEGWKRTQEVIESIELGGEGFMCVLDNDGKIACHPDIDSDPYLKEINLGEQMLLDLNGQAQGRLGNSQAAGIATGVADFGLGGKHYVATVQDPTTGSRLVIHQPVSGLEAAIGTTSASVLAASLLIGIPMILLTAGLAALLVGAHDKKMARWNSQLETMVAERTESLVRSHRTVLFGIAKLAEHRDNDTGKHVERMCIYSRILAERYASQFGGIDEAWVGDVEIAAAMHDIGKVSIPDSILLKPGKLTEEEFDRMKLHASVGEEALMSVREEAEDTTLLDLGIEIAGGHHERWDGKGYPRGLAGTSIPLSARIVAVADVFDALMSKRPYKDAMPFDKVQTIIRESSGEHFDPQVVECFEAVADELRQVHNLHQDHLEPPSLIPHAETNLPQSA